MAEGTVEALSRSASVPALPPVHGRAPSARAQAAHPREQFLSGLLNEDLQKLTKWHGSRPLHEQKRFLRSVGTMYKAFESVENGSMATQARKLEAARRREEDQAHAAFLAASAAAAQRAAVEDPLNGPPRDTPRGMTAASSAPSLQPGAKPIDVFEQSKRRQFKQKRGPDDEDPNTLAMWMEGMSMASGTTATTASTQMTRFSQITRTSDGGSSLCSEPGTTNQLHFRYHKRGMALNKNRWKAPNPHEAGNLKDGIPTVGFPESERMMTQFKEAFGDVRQQGAHITKEMYDSVLKSNSHPFVHKFLETAAPKQKDQFAEMVRCLEYLRKADHSRHMSVQKEEMNLEENRRLFKPARQRQVFDTSEINVSKVPLGCLSQGKKKLDRTAVPPATPPPAASQPQPPPSPSVSGLGSLPLSRLSTPAVL